MHAIELVGPTAISLHACLLKSSTTLSGSNFSDSFAGKLTQLDSAKSLHHARDTACID